MLDGRHRTAYALASCAEQFNFCQETMAESILTYLTYKTVTLHTAGKPWRTDYFRQLIRPRQRARMSGDMDEARRLRNLVNRTAPQLRQQCYQSKIASLEESSSRDWWKQITDIMGASFGNANEMQGLANKSTNGDMAKLVNSMNDLFVSVSEDLPRLQPSHPVFDVREHISIQA